MNPWKTILLTLAIMAYAFVASSQCVPDAQIYLETNQVKAIFYNGSDMWWDLNDGSAPSYVVPKASGKSSGFAAGIWMGGLDGTGGLHVSASTYRQLGVDYFPGPVRSTGDYQCDTVINVLNGPLRKGVLPLPTGKVLILSSNYFSVYDYKTGQVSQHPLPKTKSACRPILLPNGKVWIVGDEISEYPNPNPTLLIDTTNYTVSNGITLNHYHHNSSVIKLTNGKIMVCGLGGTELYNPTTNTSTSISGPNTPRQGGSLMLGANGKVVLVGGSMVSYTSSAGSKLIDVYETATNSWTAGPGMSVNRYNPALALKSNGRIIVLGGESNSAPLNKVGLLDPAQLTYSIVGSLPAPGYLQNSNFYQVEAHFTPQGKLIIIGDEEIGYLDPTAYTYTEIGVRDVSTESCILSNGEVFIESKSNSAVFRRFDPVKDLFVWANWQKMWKVSQAQISQFQNDFANNSVNYANYPDIRTWPAHGSVGAGEDYHLAPFQDANGDGAYIPGWAGDYPCVPGDEAIYTVFNDDAGPHGESQGDKLGVQVESLIYAYDCSAGNCADTALDFTTFYHYEVTNKSNNSYHDFYFSFWTDIDLGNWWDDYLGTDTVLPLVFAYNADADDDGSYGYGPNPPAVGTLVLNSPNNAYPSSVITYEINTLVANQGHPQIPIEFYRYQQGLWKDGTNMPEKYIYSGDPGFCGGNPTGSYETGAGHDGRYMVNFGPLNFAAGDTLVFDFAQVWARAYYNDNLGSVCELKQDAATIKSWWNSQSNDCFHLSVGRNHPVSGQQLTAEIFPNPAQNLAEMRLSAPLKSGSVLNLRDALGRVVFTQPVASGTTSIQIQTAGLGDGLYVVSLGNEISQKLVVRH
ncbi:MAG: T9SS type A sorting domain-containing protein [Bacteroidia bacterium]|nr:T9SS type A sorting domain-containing protein [Bacteroidia bacterium]